MLEKVTMQDKNKETGPKNMYRSLPASFKARRPLMSHKHSNMETQPAREAPDLSDGPWQNFLRAVFHRKVRWTLGGVREQRSRLL